MLAALQSMNVSHSRAYLNRINVPVLALVGEHDPVTPYSDIAPLLNHIPSVRTHIISGARHDLLNEGDAALTEAWALIEAFIKDVALVKNVTTLDGMVVKTAAE
jgi:alpha-beta hydrolase superfamily lysophospholipase